MKFEATYSCGHTGTVELYGKNEERQRKLNYFKKSVVCPQCFQTQRNEANSKLGLIINVSVLPTINSDNGSILAYLWFTGDSKTHKDEISSLGYRWGELMSAATALATKAPEKVWAKVVDIDQLKKELSTAKELGAKHETEQDLFAAAHYQIALERQKEWQAKSHMLGKIQKPTRPEFIAGKRWNGKFYGKGKAPKKIYLDGDPMELTESEEQALNDYLGDIAEYEQRLKEIRTK